MEPIVFYDFKPDTEDPNNKIVIKNKTYAAGYQDGLKEPRPAQVWMTSKRGFDTEPKVLSI